MPQFTTTNTSDSQEGRKSSSISRSFDCYNSPIEIQVSDLVGRRERRPPSITPRKFNRFFMPRSQSRIPIKFSRGVLDDITAPVNNRNGIQSSPLRPSNSIGGLDDTPTKFTREMKRRKLAYTPSPSPDDANVDKKYFFDRHHVLDNSSPDTSNRITSSQLSASIEDSIRGSQILDSNPITIPAKHIKRLRSRGPTGQFLQLSLQRNTASSRQYLSNHLNDWQDHTADFQTGPDDIHFCASIEGSARSIPFCATSCNTNSLVAIGDEEGHVRLLESAKNGKPQFKDVFLSFRPHLNAIIDMSFSLDDSFLATASGDQTARVIDMTTQRTISVLAHHSASLKQVKFQPGAASNSVIATSSRDGSVQIWDLRCKGAQGPAQSINVPMDPTSLLGARPQISTLTYCCLVNSIYDAHRSGFHGRPTLSLAQGDGPSRGELPGRIGDVSVTAISFLPEGQEHMLLTASEANASIKLWDVRSLHHTRRKTNLPISCTALPESHNQWRHFGINSINLSGDGSRIYALCRDNTVYAYSTPHLIVGQAPELSDKTSRRRKQKGDVHEGLGPLYGFRHRQLHATSFYVKAAIRPARGSNAELLAVGSCDGCTVLFPTDERYLQTVQSASEQLLHDNSHLRRHGSTSLGTLRSKDSIVISENGTPLIRGHDREIGALTWTFDGDLVTVGDDFLIRRWRESPSARELRNGGEEGGRRWGCGWADIPDSFDEDEND